MDVEKGVALQRGGMGNLSELHGNVEPEFLVAVGQQLFHANPSSDHNDYVSEQVEKLRGLHMVGLLLDGADVFLGRVPGSPYVVLLKIRHSNPPTDPVVRGRSVRNLLDANQNEGVAEAVRTDTQRSASSYRTWKNFWKLFTKNEEKAEPKPWLGLLESFVKHDDLVASADLFDVASGEHRDHFHAITERPRSPEGSERLALAVQALFQGNFQLETLLRGLGLRNTKLGKVQLQIGNLDYYWLRVPYFPTLHIPFERQRALVMYKAPRPNPSLDWSSLDQAGLNILRIRIGALLDGGLKTTTEPFPETVQQFQGILDELGRLPPDDLVNRLDLGGFLSRPMQFDDLEQRCQECIYYLPHRQWCDLPELPVPVKPDWWCRLWKI